MIDMNDIENLIARCAPALMRNATAIEHDAVGFRGKRPSAQKGWKVLTPEMKATIMSLHANGMGKTDIAAEIRVNVETVTTFLRQNGVKTDKAAMKSLRSSPLSGVKRVQTK